MLKRKDENYHTKLKEVSQEIFIKYNLIKYANYNNENEKELLKEIYLNKFYNILLNIVNQEIYDNIYEMTAEDIDFIINFQIDKILSEIIKIIYKTINIKKLKNQIKKENKKIKH